MIGPKFSVRKEEQPVHFGTQLLTVIYARRSDNSFAQTFDSKSPDGTQTAAIKEIFDAKKSQTIITKSAVIRRYSAREYQQQNRSSRIRKLRPTFERQIGPKSAGKQSTKWNACPK
ncbi:MAG TPA: hypothetical protein VEX68_18250 [Bryobacteraceae bacterium]|nr:hypothetical protein [Bryobacteraceae bacterium]